MHCPKCHRKMEVGEGMIYVKVGDTELKTMAVIHSCHRCNKHSGKIDFRVEPIRPILQEQGGCNNVKTDTDKSH